MRLVGRLPLDARRSLCLVRIADRVLVVGVSEAGLTRLSELDASELGNLDEPQAAPSFATVLGKLGVRKTADQRLAAVSAQPVQKEQGE